MILLLVRFHTDECNTLRFHPYFRKKTGHASQDTERIVQNHCTTSTDPPLDLRLEEVVAEMEVQMLVVQMLVVQVLVVQVLLLVGYP